jgi:hypothetical protein
MRRIAQECTGDSSWNFDIPVFFVDSDIEILGDRDSEEELYRHPAIIEWYNRSLNATSSPFCGWQDLGQNVPPLVRARFDFMLLEEWARSRPPVSTRVLQAPVREFFRARPVTETEIVKDNIDHIDERTGKEKRTRVRNIVKKVPVTQMENYPVQVERDSEGFWPTMGRVFTLGIWNPTHTVTEWRTREVTRYIDVPLQEVEEYEEVVTAYVKGIRHQTVRVTRTGRELLGWEVGAKWKRDQVREHWREEREVLSDDFTPTQ